MSNRNQVVIIHDGEVFSPFYFYNSFLPEIASFYKNLGNKGKQLSFSLTDYPDYVMSKYWVDPISIPLLLSLSQQLRLHQANPIQLELLNVPSTNALIEFLYRADFFYVSGDNMNPTFPKGKNIFAFDKVHLGGFSGKQFRPEHKVRCYSLNDEDDLLKISHGLVDEDEKRDLFVEHYSYMATKHFWPLLQEFADDKIVFYTEVLSELITNGVIHSGTDVFALMFSDRFSTKFSVSDNGIGFESSLLKKEDTFCYKKLELFNSLIKEFNLKDDFATRSLLYIFEALYYSMMKNRVGLFDLMISVVNDYQGYMRLHTDYAQVVFSVRMRDEVAALNDLRTKIRKLYSQRSFELITEDVFRHQMSSMILNSKLTMIALFKRIWENYNEDVKFSSIRFYPVRFRGVHVEAEISK